MLAFAVFAWGLQYKLSLYHSAGRTNAVPAAKLLSSRERHNPNTQIEEILLAGRPLGAQVHQTILDRVATLPGIAYPTGLDRSRELLGPQHSTNVPRFPELTSSLRRSSRALSRLIQNRADTLS
jgi:hypothetical protein